MLESGFQSDLIRELEYLLPGAIVFKTDPRYIQGFPDLIILYKDRWAALEVKASLRAKRQPNQDYYVRLLDSWSYAAFICPENKRTIFYELQRALQS